MKQFVEKKGSFVHRMFSYVRHKLFLLDDGPLHDKLLVSRRLAIRREIVNNIFCRSGMIFLAIIPLVIPTTLFVVFNSFANTYFAFPLVCIAYIGIILILKLLDYVLSPA